MSLGAAAVAFGPVFVRFSELDPLATAFYRMLLALPLLWLWMRVSTPPAEGVDRREQRLIWLAGIFFAGDLAALHAAFVHTSVANSTLLLNLAPVVVTAGAWMVFRERISLTFLAGLVLALAGAWILMRAGSADSNSNLKGDMLGVLAALFYGAYLLTVSRLRRGTPTAVIMYRSALVTTLTLFVMAWWQGSGLLPLSLFGWLMLLGIALISQAAGQGLIVYALAHLPVAFSSVVQLLQPLVAVALAWWFFAEALSAGQLAGGLAVLLGVAVARRGVGKQ